MILSFTRQIRSLAVCLALLGLRMVLGSSAFGQTVFTYVGGTNNWSTSAAWAKTGTATTATYPGDAAGTPITVHNVTIASGTLNLDVDVTSRVGAVTITTGRINVPGTRTFSAASIARAGAGTIYMQGDGTLQTTGTLQVDTLNLIGNAIVNVGGDFDVRAQNTNATTGANTTLTLNGTANQTIVRALTYRNITLANTTGFVLTSNKLNVLGTTTIPVGNELRLGSINTHVLGTVNGSGTLSITGASGGTIGFPSGTFTNFLATGTGGRVSYYGSNIRYTINAVPSIGYNQVIFTGQGRRTLTQPIAVRSSLQVDVQDTLILSGAITVTMSEGSVFCQGAITSGASSSVRFASTVAAQAILGTGSVQLNDLILDKSGLNLVLGMPIRVDNSLTFSSVGKIIRACTTLPSALPAGCRAWSLAPPA